MRIIKLAQTTIKYIFSKFECFKFKIVIIDTKFTKNSKRLVKKYLFNALNGNNK